ncbi:hypothetical protein [Cellulophaga sp. HaHa_2_1]|uniref:hypothetical protein n=1 Tax=Cellulophaga sp. HaHa_2_1 TaxID=2749994 RepID=UPI001C4E8FF9|nr:hypothetical protein [Cellulophaga sp. HaHa_2_1]QXP53206.1 hypothetical protein H0I24_04525 [Cellulophaga sp. HaHa_2_1]
MMIHIKKNYKTLLRNTIFGVILLFLNSCKTADKEDIKQDEILFNKVLKQQLKAGKSALYNNSFDVELYKYNFEDLEVTIPFIFDEVKKLGYVELGEKEFNEKVNKIFKKNISDNILYVNLDDKNDKTTKIYRNDNSINIKPYSVFVSKKPNLITSFYAIPEIYNYQNESELIEFEKNIKTNIKDKDGISIKKYLWKTERQNTEKVIRTIYSRNEYLFKDNLDVVNWLLKNDSKFMFLIAKNFGFIESEEHKKWFENYSIENNNSEDVREIKKDDLFAKSDISKIKTFLTVASKEKFSTSFEKKEDINLEILIDFLNNKSCLNKNISFNKINNELKFEVSCFYDVTQEDIDDGAFSEETMYIYFNKINGRIYLNKLESGGR